MTPSTIRSEFEREQQEESRGVCPHCGQRLASPRAPGPMARRIIQAVAFVFDLEVEDIMSRHRRQRSVNARQFIYYLLRKRLGWSSTETADVMRFDHTSVLHGVRKVESAVESGHARTVERLAAIEGILERVLTDGRPETL